MTIGEFFSSFTTFMVLAIIAFGVYLHLAIKINQYDKENQRKKI